VSSAASKRETRTTELNDPVDQRTRFEESPPRAAVATEPTRGRGHPRRAGTRLAATGGFGMGIDCLLMILTEQDSIRDVILYRAEVGKGE